MPEKDISRMIVERAAPIVGQLREYFQTQLMPYGPKKEYLTPREERLRLQGMEPTDKIKLQQKMGPAEWDIYMKELYK